MCLAVPAKIVELRGAEQAVVDLQGNRLAVSVVLTPEALPGDWVLVHAGFAISRIDEADAFETWEYLRATFGTEAFEEAGGSADVARRLGAASFASVPVARQTPGGERAGRRRAGCAQNKASAGVGPLADGRSSDQQELECTAAMDGARPLPDGRGSDQVRDMRRGDVGRKAGAS